MLRFDHITTSMLLKKGKEPVNVEISLALQGRDLQKNEVQMMDVVQSALGGLWAETLLTSQGKAQLKKSIVSLADSQYGIEVDFVYILDVVVEMATLEKCLELIKEVR